MHPLTQKKLKRSLMRTMRHPKLTRQLAPAPRLTLWVPTLVACALGAVFLAVLALV